MLTFFFCPSELSSFATSANFSYLSIAVSSSANLPAYYSRSNSIEITSFCFKRKEFMHFKNERKNYVRFMENFKLVTKIPFRAKIVIQLFWSTPNEIGRIFHIAD